MNSFFEFGIVILCMLMKFQMTNLRLNEKFGDSFLGEPSVDLNNQ